MAPIFGPDGFLVKGVAAVVQPVKDAVNKVIRSINAIISAWNGIDVQNPRRITIPFYGTVGGQIVGTRDIAHLPELAQGGNILSSGAAIVGERGPELVKVCHRAAPSVPPGRLRRRRND